MKIDSIALYCFIAVSETGSFTKAAQRVCRTQSAVSQQIAKLESMLNKPLLLRGNTFGLTAEGEIFLGYARQIFALQRELMDRFRAPELVGEVRFGLPEDFASVYLAEVLADFARIHPRILLNIECDLTLNLFSRFKKQEFDLVLVKMNSPKDFPNGLEIWSEPLRWVGDPGLIQEGKPVPLVLSPQPCVYRASAIKTLEEGGRAWRLVFSSPSYAGIVAAVKAGMGVGIMPYKMIPNELTPLEVVLPSLDDTHVSLIKHSADNSAINTLEKFVLQKLKQ